MAHILAYYSLKVGIDSVYFFQFISNLPLIHTEQKHSAYIEPPLCKKRLLSFSENSHFKELFRGYLSLTPPKTTTIARLAKT
jgi:hypothetical protein